MGKASPPRVDTSIALASGTLIVLIIITVLLFILALRPHGSARFTVAPLVGTPCPTESGAPACYKATVMNVGGADARVECTVKAPADTTAVFDASNLPIYSTPVAIRPGASATFWVKMDAKNGGTISAPTVRCSAA